MKIPAPTCFQALLFALAAPVLTHAQTPPTAAGAEGALSWSLDGSTARVELARHGLESRVGPQGLDLAGEGWSLAVRTTSLGREGAPEEVGEGAVLLAGQRVELRREGLVEWFLGDERGLEQGWTIAERPGAADSEAPLWLGLRFDGLTPSLAPRKRSAFLLDLSGTSQLSYEGLTAWDATGRVLEAELDLAHGGYGIRVDDAQAVYPLHIDPWFASAPWSANGVELGQFDQYAASVAFAGDVNGDGYDDVLVGDPETSSATGRVDLFYGSATGLSATPDWSSTKTKLSYGVCVAGIGDVNKDGFDDFAVGSLFTIEVFLGGALPTQSSWEATIAISAGPQMVAAAGDVNDDGYDDMVFGRPSLNTSGQNSGRVEIAFGSPSGLDTNSPWINPPNGLIQANSRFGASVAGAGDLNGDGLDDFVAGSDDSFLIAYFGSTDGNFASHALLLPAGQNSRILAGIGDFEGGGFDDLATGHPGQNQVRIHSGSPNNTLSSTASYELAGPFVALGVSVSALGDVDQDGRGDLLAGASSDQGGSLTLFSGVPDGDPSVELVLDGLTSADAKLGRQVAGGGDVNGDGLPDVLAGAPENVVGGFPAGTAFAWTNLLPPPAYPGTPQLDFRLLTGVDTEPNGLGFQEVRPNETLRLRVESPDGSLVGGLVTVHLQVHPTGMPPGGTDLSFLPEPLKSWLTDLQLDLFGPDLLQSTWNVGPLSPAGSDLEFNLGEYTAFGVSLMYQAQIVHPSVPNGVIAWSDAHEFRLTQAPRIHVDPVNGDDANIGSAAAPMKTLAAAIAESEAREVSLGEYPELFLATGTYAQPSLLLESPISMRGGLDPVTFEPAAAGASRIENNTFGMLFRDIQAPTTIEGIEFRSTDPTGLSVYPLLANRAVDIRDCTEDLEFVDCFFRSSKGRDALDSADGESGPNGGNGLLGEDWGTYGGTILPFPPFQTPDFSTDPQGGVGGQTAFHPELAGGIGGDGGTGWFPSDDFDGQDGFGGGSSISLGGAGGDGLCIIGCDVHGKDGTDGQDGDGGTNGSPANLGGLANPTLIWENGRATDGTNGGDAGGGGGGGGGGGTYFSNAIFFVVGEGAGGGGGGAGGAGGTLGFGGVNGGASFSVMLSNSAPRFDSCTFLSAQGGSGGNGGNGGAGGLGGFGALGGVGGGVDISFEALSVPVELGDGGQGGNGGDGGNAGGGGGGHGGPSFCVASFGSSDTTGLFTSGNTFLPGPGGAPGAGGQQGGSGGVAASGVVGGSGNLIEF